MSSEMKHNTYAKTEHGPVCGFFDIVRNDDGTRSMETYVKGIPLLRFVLTNKGTAFTLEERRDLGLEGLLPPTVNTLECQLERAYKGYRRQPTDILRYQFLRNLQDRQEILFYALVGKHLEEMLPIVYTPTVGEAVQEFSHLFENSRGMSLSPHSTARAKEIVDEYPLHDVRLIVATDSSAILGIGDQGYGGLAISIGKLALYTVGGGVSPFHAMPVSLDVGTDSGEHLNDPLYLGVRQPRIRGEEYIAFLDRFVDAIHARWPRALIQWEDLAKDAAFEVLERYRNRVPSFNDDIQGTGAVTLAGVLAACNRAGTSIAEQRVVIYGAGAGGIGVADAIRNGMMRAGLTKDEARERVFVLDSRGLLTDNRKMDAYKLDFAQKTASLDQWTYAGKAEGKSPNLAETIRNGKVTVLIGLSGQPNSFNDELVKLVCEHTDRPMIFPLSNPTKLAEIHPAAAIAWSKGKAFVASGSPFDPVCYEGKDYPIGQGNNAFIFPGLGMGAIVAEASAVTDAMVLEAAYALADYTAEHYKPEDLGGTELIYPPVSALNAVSRAVAARVVRQAQADGVARSTAIPDGDLTAFIDDHFWRAEYLPVSYKERPAE